MTSVIVPPVDLAPGMPSRVVTISATDVTEGGQSMAGREVTFALSDSLDVTSGGDVIAKTSATITLDSQGNGQIRLPVYDANVRTWCGDPDWVILVKAFGSTKAIRVPAGSSTIALSALPNVRPLRGREKQWAVTGAGITVVQGAQWGASVTLDGGVLRFVLTVPPGGGADWYRGAIGSSANVDTLDDGAYAILSGTVAQDVGMPEPLGGIIESYQTAGIQIFHPRATGEPKMWQRARFSDGWTAWVRVDGNSWFKGNLDEQDGDLSTLAAGLYLVRYVGTAETWDLPQKLIGQLEVIDAATQRQIVFSPNDAGAGWGTKSDWVLATNSSGVLRDRWQRRDKAIMRTSPVVLTAPAGEYTQAVSRGAHRLAFTVPTNVGKVRVHMRPWNFRTRQEWGPAVLEGVMIAQQASEGSGTVTGPQWEVPGAAGTTVAGAGWTSDWFHVGLVPEASFLLSYGATWQDTERGLVMGQCWSHEDASEYTSTVDAVYGNGWGGFALQPFDIWIECEAPSTVPVWGYFGASNTMGMSASPSVYGSYPQLHARRNRAFCAMTAAGGWSIMDETLHDQAIVRRFGYPARMLDRVYLDLGSNIAARGATLAEAQSELIRWMNTNKNSFGTPDVYLATQIARDDITETADLAGTLSTWNEWIRYELAARDEVRGVIDFAAIFADPERPWTARKELRASPTDVHFGTVGQRMRAQACDGTIQLPISAARSVNDMGADAAIAAYRNLRGL